MVPGDQGDTVWRGGWVDRVAHHKGGLLFQSQGAGGGDQMGDRILRDRLSVDPPFGGLPCTEQGTTDLVGRIVALGVGELAEFEKVELGFLVTLAGTVLGNQTDLGGGTLFPRDNGVGGESLAVNAREALVELATFDHAEPEAFLADFDGGARAFELLVDFVVGVEDRIALARIAMGCVITNPFDEVVVILVEKQSRLLLGRFRNEVFDTCGYDKIVDALRNVNEEEILGRRLCLVDRTVLGRDREFAGVGF